MKKTLIALLSILLIAFAFTACDNGNKGPAGPTEEEQTAANDLATTYMGTLQYGDLIDKAINKKDPALTFSSDSKTSLTIEFKDYKVSGTGDNPVNSIKSGAIKFDFTETAPKTTTAILGYSVSTVEDKPLVFVHKDKTENKFIFSVEGEDCKISLETDTSKITGITKDTLVEFSKPTDATIKVNDIEVTYEDIAEDVGEQGSVTVPPEGTAITSEAGFKNLTAGGKYYLANSFTATNQIVIDKAITLDGNGKTISRKTPTTDASEGDKAIILINANGVEIEDLTVSGTDVQAAWNGGEWGIKVFNATDVVLSNVTVTKANAGIQVNSSEVTLTGTITVSGNTYGGIGVTKSEDSTLRKSTLTASSANIVCADEDVPALWLDAAGYGDITAPSSMTEVKPVNKEKTGQTWYITSAQVGKEVDHSKIESSDLIQTEDALNSAISSANVGDIIHLGKDIPLSKGRLIINKAITLDGHGFTISRAAGDDTTSANKSVIEVSSDNVTIRNLIVDETSSHNSWNYGEWGIKVFNSKDVTVKDVTVKNANAGIQVLSSDVTMVGGITLTNNSFGGIGVTQSSDKSLPIGTLDIANALIDCNNKMKPAVYCDSADVGKLTGMANLQTFSTANIESKKDQVWYITEAQATAGFTASNDNAATAETFTN